MSNDLAVRASESGLAVRSNVSIAPGIEGMDDRDMKIGSVVLVQPLTKVFTKKGILPGKFANTVSEQEIKDTAFVPAYMTKVYQAVKWEGKDKATFLFTTAHENDARLNGLRRRNDGDLKAEVIPVIKVIALMEGRPVIINFKKLSGYPAGQKLYTYSRDLWLEKKLPIWGQKYRLVSKDQKNKAGTEYLAMEVEVIGETTAEERSLAENLHQGFKQQPEPVADEGAAVDESVVPF